MGGGAGANIVDVYFQGRAFTNIKSISMRIFLASRLSQDFVQVSALGRILNRKSWLRAWGQIISHRWRNLLNILPQNVHFQCIIRRKAPAAGFCEMNYHYLRKLSKIKSRIGQIHL